MPKPKLTPEDESWLAEYLATLPKDAFNFNFEEATWEFIEDRGIEWVKANAGYLRTSAEEVANL